MDAFERMFFHIAEHARQLGNNDVFGYVKEVSGDRVRCVIGIKHDGSELLSPWMSTSNHRGGSRERRLYEKGQTVRISSQNGDLRNGSLTAFAESDSHPAPAHADQVNGDSTQLGKLRVSKNRPGNQQQGGGQGQGGGGGGGSSSGGQGGTHFHDIWIAEQDEEPPQHQDQSGKSMSQGTSFGSSQMSGQQQGQQQQGQQQQTKAAMKFRVDEKGYLTGRVGEGDKAARFAAHANGAKIRMGENTVWVDSSGVWTSKPMKLKKDGIPNDDG